MQNLALRPGESGRNRVLAAIADDELALIVSSAICFVGATQIRVTSGDDCIKELTSSAFNCLILQWELGDQGALTTLDWISGKEDLTAFPRVVIGKALDDTELFNAYSHGADVVLQSPVTVEDLAGFLRKIT